MSDLTQVDQPGVTDEKQPRFPEGSLDLVGEGARGEAASNGGTPHVSGHQNMRQLSSTDSSLPCKLEDSPLSLRSTCNDEHIQRILDLHKAQLAAQVMIKATLCLLVIVMYLILEAINYYYYYYYYY